MNFKHIFRMGSGVYKFSKKIPNSSINFSFSLETKNLKIAKKRAKVFLLESFEYFLYLKRLSKEEIMAELDEIQMALIQYKNVAKIEYSELEKSRHEHFSFNGCDGSDPEAIDFWLKEMKKYTSSSNKTEKQFMEFGRKILSRATIELKHFYGTEISKEDRLTFFQLLIKAEASLLKLDHQRSLEYFSLDAPIAPSYDQNLEEMFSRVLDNKLGIKQNSQSFIEKLGIPKEEVFTAFKESAPVIKRYKRESYMYDHTLNLLAQSSEKEYLSEYTDEDYEKFFQAFLYFPSNVTKKPLFYKSFQGNYYELAKHYKRWCFENDEDTEDFTYVKEDVGFIYNETLYKDPFVEIAFEDCDIQGETTLFNKYTIINNFFKFCVENDFLKKNPISKDRDFRWKGCIKEVGESLKTRHPFSTEEISKMFKIFIERDFLLSENLSHFMIPMIAIFSGMRLEEICKLRKEDIVLHNGFYCFDINGHVKTKDSIRKIPIHKYLLKNLRFLEYVESRENYLFDVNKVKINGRYKFSKKYSGIFGTFRTEFVSAERIKNQIISFHSFRHFFSQSLYSNNVSKDDISVLLGHKMEGSETPTYLKEDTKRQAKSLEKLILDGLKMELDMISMKFSKVKFPKPKK